MVPLVIEVALLVAPLAAAACTGDDAPPPVDAAVDAEPDTPVI